MRLSLLDRSRTRAGYPEAAALRHSVERAAAAEALGYHRFWGAEHHAVPGIASGSPAVLLAAAGAHTSRIRLGSGGVMLPHHQPLVVAEQFLMLEALYPGRVDLGIGRTLGFTEPVRRALRQETDDVEQFSADIAELRSFLEREAPVTARPVAATMPQLFLLATGRGITTAARLGLPVVIGGPVLHSPDLPEMLAAYRRDFQGSAAVPEPSVMVSLDVFIADTREEAHELALPEAWAMARSRETGQFDPLEPAEKIRSQKWSPRTRSRVDESLQRVIAGPRGSVSSELEQLIGHTAAEELLVSTSTYDREALAGLDADLAELILRR
ncbi:LLM class flavin-dependent oxidoreductase [Nesterenkonia muleiensis]|uniref:LLM class flavin-dependent oxidoreductase n=1 Tax=Nesterenkonia muleiensis TaxID=2282648 RepID=UPI000E72087E|nr:LLM class flavin-dependent oxidoreductase [Nesterenkonia muleiensis]